MKKITIDVLSKATSAPAQGVGSAFLEQTKLLEELGKDDFTLAYNKHSSKFDLYHVHSINPTFYLMMKKRRRTICYVHFLPETLKGSIRLPKPIFSLFCRYVVSFYKRAKEIVVVNPAFIKPLVTLGIKEENITYIPNFVDERCFYPLPLEEKMKIREKYNLPKDKKIIISVGQIQTRKGVLDFLETARLCPEYHFLWVGGFSFKGLTDGYQQLKKEIEKKRDNVTFLGIVPREEMNALYNASDIFFLASYNELFPMSLLEACSVGIPYVVRNLDLYKDILLGYYLTGKTNEEFASAIKKLGSDQNFYQQAAELSLAIKDKYSRASIYQMWKAYYNRILAKYPLSSKE